MKSANEISLSEVFQLITENFSDAKTRFLDGEYSVWIGSGISRNPPNLGELLSRAVEHLRAKYIEEGGSGKFSTALKEVIGLTSFNFDEIEPLLNKPFNDWSKCSDIISQLWDKYSDVLNTVIEGEKPDYMLWNAVDVREAFKGRQNPGVEHLCIAILTLEGAIKSIASANWDGCLENAIIRVAGTTGGVLKIVVDPDDLLSGTTQAELVKFHGCIESATSNPAKFRSLLVATDVGILKYQDDPKRKAIHNRLITMAAEDRVMTAGLSLQDINLQQVFSTAGNSIAKTWPDNASAIICCEDTIRDGQKKALQITYGDDVFAKSKSEILEASHIRSWPDKVFTILVFELIAAKLCKLISFKYPYEGEAKKNLTNLVKCLTANELDLYDFVSVGIELWSRMLNIFRHGKLPDNKRYYQTISPSSLSSLNTDFNVQSSGLAELALGLSLLGEMVSTGKWRLKAPEANDVSSGAVLYVSNQRPLNENPIVFINSVASAIQLQKEGGMSREGAVVIHSDNSWDTVINAGKIKNVRSAKGKYGRTGSIEAQHISIPSLIASHANYDEIVTTFEAMSIV